MCTHVCTNVWYVCINICCYGNCLSREGIGGRKRKRNEEGRGGEGEEGREHK